MMILIIIAVIIYILIGNKVAKRERKWHKKYGFYYSLLEYITAIILWPFVVLINTEL